ncbi:MAG: S9 family peptidase [Candidatus Eremiobacterota bacterium]
MSKKRNITIDDMFRFKLINSPEISPDGEKIVFTYKWTDLKENTYYSNLYMAYLKTDRVFRFTYGNHNDLYPLWSPDGKHILFRTDRDKEKKGLWIIPCDGGEARPLITDKGSIGEYIWSPDSKYIYYTFRKSDDPLPLEHVSNDPEYKIKDEDHPYSVIDEIPYKGKNGQIKAKGKFNIYSFEIATEKKQHLTKEEYDDFNPCISHDGKKLAFCSNRSDDHIEDHENNDIYVMDLKTKKVKKITEKWGMKTGLCWSKDDKFIFFTGHHAPKGMSAPEHLKIYKIPSEGGKVTLLTKDFNGYVSNMLIGDTREFDDIVQQPMFTDKDKNIIFCASYEGGCYLYKVSTEGGKPERIEEGRHEIVYYSMDKSGENIAILRGDMTNLSEVYHYKKKKNTWDVKKLTSYNDFVLKETTVTEPEEIWITTGEGVKLQGWLLKPPKFDPKKKYPLIHEIHGGPHILYGYTFFHEMQYFASKGYCVLFINPRGSKGYGTEFAAPIDGHWGGPDFTDQMEFLDHVISLGYIDKDRLFVTGGSYGGYMTNWVVTQTDRYRGAVSHRSVSNCATVFGVSSGCYHFEQNFGGVPWRDAQHYIDRSPLYQVENVKTPILIMHSENDHLTPICEAEQFFVALKYLKKKARFVRFKSETHELSRGGKPTNRRARLDLSLDWIKNCK